MSNILILDGNQRSALAATRSLGMKGHEVYVVDSTPQSLAGSSRHCTGYIQLVDIDIYHERFIEELQVLISKYNIEVLMPMTDVSTATILSQPDQFQHVNIPAPPFESYNLASDKNSLFKLALQLNVPIPKTHFISSINQIETAIKDVTYPAVIKPSCSRILINGQWVSTHVSFTNSRDDLLDQIKNTSWLNSHPFMIQEHIKGQGQGVFTFYNKGKPVTFFAHKRLREKPPSGGVSVLRESIPVDIAMQEIFEKLLEKIGWHGAAMIEFIVSSDGTPYLIEINGRFWGSLQLSIDAGIDFPHLAYLLAANKPLPTNINYKSHIRSRWLLGDLDHLYLTLKSDNKKISLPEKFSAIIEFMKFYQKNTHYEVNRLNDIKPFIFELKNYFKKNT